MTAPEAVGECWVWTGNLTKMGYGNIVIPTGHRPGNHKVIHKFVWEALNGPVPAGLELDHLCRVRACYNPAHLEAVTHRENTRRGIRGQQLTRCPHGDEFRPVGEDRKDRHCRVCRNDRLRRNRAAKADPPAARPLQMSERIADHLSDGIAAIASAS